MSRCEADYEQDLQELGQRGVGTGSVAGVAIHSNSNVRTTFRYGLKILIENDKEKGSKLFDMNRKQR